jgi:hypothetical protein
MLQVVVHLAPGVIALSKYAREKVVSLSDDGKDIFPDCRFMSS